MTKSQNTKNEQHCIKQNEKSFIQKDLSLTEQWKKEHSIKENQHYYIKDTRDNIYIDFFWGDGWLDNSNEDILEVLAPVPTFEEWQASEKYNKHLEEVIKVYERKDKQATETSIAYNELLDENTKLKELLKWCAKIMREPEFYIGTLEEKERYINNLHKKQQLLHEIDEVLK